MYQNLQLTKSGNAFQLQGEIETPNPSYFIQEMKIKSVGKGVVHVEITTASHGGITAMVLGEIRIDCSFSDVFGDESPRRIVVFVDNQEVNSFETTAF